MSGLENTQLAVQAMEKRDFAAFERLINDDFMIYTSLPTPLGIRGFIEVQQALMDAIPDWKFNASNFKEENDNKVTYTQQVTGTHTGTLHLESIGIPVMPPTGKSIRLPEEKVIVTLRDDKASRVEIPLVPGGSVEGLLAQIGIKIPHNA